MAVIHRARINPSKAELIAAWLPSQPWSGGDPSPFELVGAYRFDDPAGEVGIETHLVRTGRGEMLQVPLTYRGAPLAGAERHLVGTTEHSHLGRRWVYDACGDPVYAAVLATVIRTGGREAEQWVEGESGPERREVTTRVAGSGTAGAQVPVIDAVSAANGPAATTIAGPGWELVVLRAVGSTASPDGAETLTGTWPGGDDPALLAFLRR
jgi:Maltokinase N-terminal cap domain